MQSPLLCREGSEATLDSRLRALIKQPFLTLLRASSGKARGGHTAVPSLASSPIVSGLMSSSSEGNIRVRWAQVKRSRLERRKLEHACRLGHTLRRLERTGLAFTLRGFRGDRRRRRRWRRLQGVSDENSCHRVLVGHPRILLDVGHDTAMFPTFRAHLEHHNLCPWGVARRLPRGHRVGRRRRLLRAQDIALLPAVWSMRVLIAARASMLHLISHGLERTVATD